MNNYVKLNSDWVSHYDSTDEINKIKVLTKKLGFSTTDVLLIADIGCGNGRSTKWISRLFPNALIYAIDIMKDSLTYARKVNQASNIKYIHKNAFDFFNDASCCNKYDLIFFSWSLFDMISEYTSNDKIQKLDELITAAKKTLSSRGYIIVLQPTKGGDFEKLLSKFMPESDDDYYITHNYLISNNFHGPSTPFPNKDAPDAIWSNFICNRLQLFYGIESIVMLETGRLITNKEFDTKVNSFLYQSSKDKEDLLYLSDCVNIYYVAGKK